MAWTWEEIKREWLGESQPPDAPSIIVDAFSRVDAAFGGPWIEATRSTGGITSQGSLAVLHIMGIARDLAALDGIAGADRLIRKIGQRDRSAHSEALAIHLLRSGWPTSQIELEPAIIGSTRKPDFRIRHDEADTWLYVEVTRPDTTSNPPAEPPCPGAAWNGTRRSGAGWQGASTTATSSRTGRHDHHWT